jgi:hypothetical protein
MLTVINWLYISPHTRLQDMYLLGNLEHGAYPNVRGVHPETSRHYLDEDLQAALDANTTGELRQTIREELEANVHHDNDVLASYPHPFETDDQLVAFEKAFSTAQELGIIPNGYGMLPHELEDGIYPASEVIKVARKDVDIPLPLDIWFPRAAKWVQALHLMVSILQGHLDP